MRKIPLITLLLTMHGALHAQEPALRQWISKGASQRVNSTWLAYRNLPGAALHHQENHITFPSAVSAIRGLQNDAELSAFYYNIRIEFENDSNSFTLEAETPPATVHVRDITAGSFNAARK